MRKNYQSHIIFWLFFLMTLVSVVDINGQTAGSSEKSFPELITQIDLSNEKLKTTAKLTQDFLMQIQLANRQLTELITSSVSPARPAAKNKEQMMVLKREFRQKMLKYASDLETVIGHTAALQLTEKIFASIPRVLTEGVDVQPESTSKERSLKWHLLNNRFLCPKNQLIRQ
jgi:hypothetical protein